MKNSFRIAGFALGAALFFGAGIADYTVIDGLATFPPHPVAADGETVPFVIKGKTVYVTPLEKDATVAIPVVKFSGLVILVGLWFTSNPWQKRKTA